MIPHIGGLIPPERIVLRGKRLVALGRFPNPLVARLLKGRILFENPGGILPGLVQKADVPDKVGHPQVRQAGLPYAPKLARTPHPQVGFRNVEPAGRVAQHPQTFDPVAGFRFAQ